MDYRRQFRFLPWLSAPAARPTPSPRPDLQTSTSTQPQRPPFRPPGIAPVPAPRPQSDAPPSTRIASVTPSPAPTEPNASSLLPRRGTEHETSRPASPTPTTTQSQPTEPTPPTQETRLFSLPPSQYRQARGPMTIQPASPPPAPTQTQPSQATEAGPSTQETKLSSLQPSPSRQARESRTTQPASLPPAPTQSQLSQATEFAPSTQDTRASSLPPSPSRRATEQRITQPTSPARATSQTQFSQATEPVRPSPETRASTTPPSPQTGSRDLGTSKASPIATEATQTKAAGSPTRARMPAKASPSQSQDSKLEATQEKAIKVPLPSSSPSQFTTQTTSQLPSESRMQKDQTVEAVTQPQSPSKQPKTTKEESSKLAAPERPLPFQQEPKVAALSKELLDAQQKIYDISKAIKIPHPEKAPTTASLKLDELRKGKAAPQKPVEQEKAKLLDSNRALQRKIPDAQEKSKEPPDSDSEARKLHQLTQKATEREKTTGNEEKDIKILSATLPKEYKPGNGNHKGHEAVPLHKGITEDISSMVQKLSTGHKEEQASEKPVSIITLAGENRGASMHVSSESAKKDTSVHIYRGYKLNPDESPDFTTDAEENSRGIKHGDSMTEQDTPRQAYINSNLQGINNSIMLSSSVTERDSGVHLSFYETATEAPKASAESDTRKNEFSVTRAEKLTYEPTVRRRCLRGLFLESSESDTEKPRRHGCRYICSGKGKDKDISVA